MAAGAALMPHISSRVFRGLCGAGSVLRVGLCLFPPVFCSPSHPPARVLVCMRVGEEEARYALHGDDCAQGREREGWPIDTLT